MLRWKLGCYIAWPPLPTAHAPLVWCGVALDARHGGWGGGGSWRRCGEVTEEEAAGLGSWMRRRFEKGGGCTMRARSRCAVCGGESQVRGGKAVPIHRARSLAIRVDPRIVNAGEQQAREAEAGKGKWSASEGRRAERGLDQSYLELWWPAYNNMITLCIFWSI